MANGQQRSEDNLNKFEQWIATQADKDLKQIIHRGQLNRGEVAKGCGFGKSALRQNPKIKIRLEEIETDLRDRNILPTLTPKAIKDKAIPKKYNPKASNHLIEAKKLATLEKEVLELKVENQLLKEKLERYTELSDVISELGVMPR